MDGVAIAFESVDPASAEATWALEQYFTELADRFVEGFDVVGALAAGASAMSPPDGVFLVIRCAGAVVGCGGAQRLDGATHEIKRMWIDRGSRGQGLARQLLEQLEQSALDRGSTRIVLDTNSALTEAVAMYARLGYRPIERYSDNPHAMHWFEKQLVGRAGTADQATPPR